MISLNAIGEVATMQYTHPIVGSDPVSFTDTTTGVTASRTVLKQFRYSIDGFFWSDLLLLTNGNLLSIQHKPYEPIFIEAVYTRTGTDTTGTITISNFAISTTNTTIPSKVEFERLYSNVATNWYDPELHKWSSNLLDKLYRAGIVAWYINRGVSKETQRTTDRDYIDFWRSVSVYHSVIVQMARSFRKIKGGDIELMRDYLVSRGYHCDRAETEQELASIMSNLYSIVFERTTSSTNTELHNLFSKERDDDFIYVATDRWESSWHINKTSPLYTGVDTLRSFNKFEKYLFDLSKYNLQDENACEIIDNTMIIYPSGGPNGIGKFNFAKALPVNTALSYTFSVIAKTSGKIFAGFYFFDSAGSPIEGISSIDGNSLTHTISDYTLNIDTEKYRLSFTIFPEGTAVNGSRNNIGAPNFIFPENAAYVVPIFMCDAQMELENILFTPTGAKYSYCFVNGSKLLHIWVKNRNNRENKDTILRELRRTFVPYNTSISHRIFDDSSPGDSPLVWEQTDFATWQSALGPWYW